MFQNKLWANSGRATLVGWDWGCLLDGLGKNEFLLIARSEPLN